MRTSIGAVVLTLLAGAALARDNGRWADRDPRIRAWYDSLMQPDREISCCGKADAYYADTYVIKNGQLIATITDSRGNSIPVGTQIVVPPNKINKDANIVGHVVIFLGGRAEAPIVYCFVPGTGV